MHAEQLRLSSDQAFRLLNKPEQIEVASLKRITPLCHKIVCRTISAFTGR